MDNLIIGPVVGEPVDVKNAYEAINTEKESFGKYHKTIFHVHTPDSYDYKFYEAWGDKGYQQKNETDIAEEFLKLYASGYKSIYKHAPENINTFDNEKQFWAFMALAKTIVDKGIEVVVVADHHTLKGIKKLEEAIAQLHKLKPFKVCPEVIGGVEISCADKVHVVGIFNHNNEETTKLLNEWIDEILISPKEGTIKTSYDAIKELSAFGVIPYIAHVNTADIFVQPSLYSGGYRKKLFTLNELSLVGTKNRQLIDSIKNRLKGKDFRGRDIDIIFDNDSHSIDTIDNNITWVKGQKRNYDMIAEAINDYNVSIKLKESEPPSFFIKGVFIEPKYLDTNTNFLIKDQNHADEPFAIRFSSALNCIIGGRGTGKSTLLRLLEFALSLKCNDRTELEYLCQHGNIWVLFEKGSLQYMVGMLTPYLSDEKGEKYYYLAPEKEQRNEFKRLQNSRNRELAKKRAFQEIVKVYKIENKGGKNIFCQVRGSEEKSSILKELYDTSYSVNDLVNIANDEMKLTSFLKSRFLFNPIHSKAFPLLSKEVRFKSTEGLKVFINNLPKLLQKRTRSVKQVLHDFNKQKKNTLKIEYIQDDGTNEIFSFEKCFDRSNFGDGNYFSGYSITDEGVYNYLYSILNQMTIVDFFEMLINHKQKMYHYSLLNFSKGYERRNIIVINEQNQYEVIDEIIKVLLSNYNVNNYIKKYFKSYLDSIEKFELQFDLSSNSINKDNAREFKNVKKLSLGQKVVAMLSFILAFSDYGQDYRPLLIDQPEDNLDSQYIYNSLVERLREIKDKRQVIIATHNATIVTNAMADHVCVMNSDGKHGWIESRGYPGTEKIKKAIINYLEGGVDSFRHKEKIYKKVLDKETNKS